MAGEPKNRSARDRAVSNAARSPASSAAAPMPIPPPPPAALTMTGYPIRSASVTAVATSVTGSRVPGETGTPACSIRFLARILSPICSMAPGPGPTQVSPASITWRAKSAFSARKP